MLFIKSFGVWVLFAILAVINGVVRNQYIAPGVGEYAGHVISSVILISLILIVTFLFVRYLKETASKGLLLIGIFWLMLTVVFEFVFGHYVAGHPWERLLADYHIAKGRLWSLVLLTTFLAPLVCGKVIKGSRRS